MELATSQQWELTTSASGERSQESCHEQTEKTPPISLTGRSAMCGFGRVGVPLTTWSEVAAASAAGVTRLSHVKRSRADWLDQTPPERNGHGARDQWLRANVLSLWKQGLNTWVVPAGWQHQYLARKCRHTDSKTTASHPHGGSGDTECEDELRGDSKKPRRCWSRSYAKLLSNSKSFVAMQLSDARRSRDEHFHKRTQLQACATREAHATGENFRIRLNHSSLVHRQVFNFILTYFSHIFIAGNRGLTRSKQRQPEMSVSVEVQGNVSPWTSRDRKPTQKWRRRGCTRKRSARMDAGVQGKSGRWRGSRTPRRFQFFSWLYYSRPQRSQWRMWISKRSPVRCIGTRLDKHNGYNHSNFKTKTSQETRKSLQKFFEPTRKPKVIYTDNVLEFVDSTLHLSLFLMHWTRTHCCTSHCMAQLLVDASSHLHCHPCVWLDRLFSLFFLTLFSSLFSYLFFCLNLDLHLFIFHVDLVGSTSHWHSVNWRVWSFDQ